MDSEDFLTKIRPRNVRRGPSRVRPPSPAPPAFLIFLHICESHLGKTNKCDFKGFPYFNVSLKVAWVRPTSVL